MFIRYIWNNLTTKDNSHPLSVFLYILMFSLMSLGSLVLVAYIFVVIPKAYTYFFFWLIAVMSGFTFIITCEQIKHYKELRNSLHEE